MKDPKKPFDEYAEQQRDNDHYDKVFFILVGAVLAIALIVT